MVFSSCSVGFSGAVRDIFHHFKDKKVCMYVRTDGWVFGWMNG